MTNTQRKIDPREDTRHFSGAVSQALRDKLNLIARAVKEGFIANQGFGGSYGCSNISPIYGHHVSGFIPSHLGGYDVSEFYRSDIDSSYHFTKEQTEAMQRMEKDMYESFRLDHNLQDTLPENYSHDDLPEALQNKFSDYENDWFEPALLRFEIWIGDKENAQRFNDTDKKADTVFMRLSINYKDGPYYRASHDDTLFQKSFTAKNVMKYEPEVFVKWLEEELAKVS